MIYLLCALCAVIGYCVGYKRGADKNALSDDEKKTIESFVAVMTYDGNLKGKSNGN